MDFLFRDVGRLSSARGLAGLLSHQLCSRATFRCSSCPGMRHLGQSLAGGWISHTRPIFPWDIPPKCPLPTTSSSLLPATFSTILPTQYRRHTSSLRSPQHLENIQAPSAPTLYAAPSPQVLLGQCPTVSFRTRIVSHPPLFLPTRRPQPHGSDRPAPPQSPLSITAAPSRPRKWLSGVSVTFSLSGSFSSDCARCCAFGVLRSILMRVSLCLCFLRSSRNLSWPAVKLECA